jgi:hypothetical protein
MITAAVPPQRCAHCRTTRASCTDKREYQHMPCCDRCSHERKAAWT